MNPWLEGVAITTALVAMVLDLRYRCIQNRLWVLALAFMAPVLAWGAITAPLDFLVRFLVWLAWSASLVFLYRFNAFAGADAKGLIILGLAYNPLDYYEPLQGMIWPPLDALAPSLLIGGLIAHWKKSLKFPFYAVFSPILVIATYSGGILWWPIAWLARILD